MYDGDGNEVHGFCEPQFLRIQIEKGPKGRMMKTLRHEMVHAAVYSTGFWRLLQLAVEEDDSRDFLEEMLADTFAPAYLAAVDNLCK